jgi:hypothetical protein
MKGFVKDPEAVLDYSFNWALWLDGDTISTSAWAVDSPLTIDSDSETSTRTTVWISGGVLGGDYNLTNSIDTTAGRTDERTIRISVRAK